MLSGTFATAELLDITEKTVEFHISKVLKVLRGKLSYLCLLLAFVPLA